MRLLIGCLALLLPLQAAAQTKGYLEDDSTVRALMLRLLERLGYQTVEAQDGPSALEAIESDVSLLFTDVVLPGGMSGVELVSEMQKRRPELRVLFASGYTDDAIRGRLDPEVELLEKPFSKSQLASSVQSVLDREL